MAKLTKITITNNGIRLLMFKGYLQHFNANLAEKVIKMKLEGVGILTFLKQPIKILFRDACTGAIGYWRIRNFNRLVLFSRDVQTKPIMGKDRETKL